jgi:hypothetical protein
MRYWGFMVFGLMLSFGAQAEQWKSLGASSVGKHYADIDSLQRDASGMIFSIVTRVEQTDGAQWVTHMAVDCKANTFAYTSGFKLVGGEIVSRFESPRPASQIVQDSMPDELQKEYCVSLQPQWESLGKSNIADVYYDRNSVQQNADGSRFKADTMIMPFNGQEETHSTIAFDCAADNFNIIKMTRIKDGKEEQIFEYPQQAAHTSKIATLATLAKKFCGKPPGTQAPPSVPQPNTECEKVLGTLKTLEVTIQKDFDDDGLQCKQVNAYVKQIQAINKNVKKHDCAIGDLEAYEKEIREAGCRR